MSEYTIEGLAFYGRSRSTDDARNASKAARFTEKPNL